MVTVIVLVYRNKDKLEKTVKSILGQDYPEIELIVSDDCSEEFNVSAIDNSIRSYEEFNERISLIVRKNEKNLGIVRHYNQVVKISSGNIIIPLSCGDIFYQNRTVTKIYHFFEENQCILATGKRMCDGMVFPTAEQVQKIRDGGQSLIDSLCRGNFVSGACLYYARTFFEQYGYFDENFFLVEDYPMLLRVLFSGQRLLVIDEVTIIYEMTGVSSEKRPNPLFERDMNQIFELVIKPHKHDIGMETYRHLKCRNFVNTHSPIAGGLYCLLYPDVILMKMICMIR